MAYTRHNRYIPFTKKDPGFSKSIPAVCPGLDECKSCGLDVIKYSVEASDNLMRLRKEEEAHLDDYRKIQDQMQVQRSDDLEEAQEVSGDRYCSGGWNRGESIEVPIITAQALGERHTLVSGSLLFDLDGKFYLNIAIEDDSPILGKLIDGEGLWQIGD